MLLIGWLSILKSRADGDRVTEKALVSKPVPCHGPGQAERTPMREVGTDG
jgi:hypothetical protein